MPRWRPLPEELDPQIREFTSQLRRLVDRSGMSVATIADRTGYSKSSWEKYLGGRLLPPRGATHALGDVTGTDIRHLETMWELAERAWSREEMRHDVTMEAIRVAQAREALGEFWNDEPAKGRKWGRNKDRSKSRDKNRNKEAGADAGAGTAAETDGHAGDLEELPVPSGAVSGAEGPKEEEWKERTGEHAIVGPDGLPAQSSFDFFEPPSASTITIGRVRESDADSSAAPAETGRPPADDETAVLRPRPLPGQGGGAGRTDAPGRTGGGAGGRSGSIGAGVPQQRVDVASWGTTSLRRGAAAGPGRGGEDGAVAASGNGGTGAPGSSAGPPPYPGGAGSAPGLSGVPGAPDGEAVEGAEGPYAAEGEGRSSRGKRVAALLAGAGGVFAVLGVGVLVFGLPGATDDSSAAPTPSASATPHENLPAGVKCQGRSCSGKDPEKMGCGGQNVKSSNSQFVGPSMVEVRYSKVCKAAWGRITGAAQGDSLKISVGDGQAESDEVGETNDAYTEMVAVDSATEARACATLVAGTTGCTKADSAGQAGTAENENPAGTGGTEGSTGTGGNGTEEKASSGGALR